MNFIYNNYYYHHHLHLFMQGIYTYIPETNYVRREYSVAAILLLLFMVLISLVSVLNLLYFYISTFRSMCAVLNMAVLWSFLSRCFPGMLLMYFLNDFERVPVALLLLVSPSFLHSTCAVLLLLLLLLTYLRTYSMVYYKLSTDFVFVTCSNI